jgi:drug/metabolite transporter (DMT)-like permease
MEGPANSIGLAPGQEPLYKFRVRRNLGNLSTGSGLGAILLWSTTFAFARSLSERIVPLTAGAAAYLIGGSFCMLRLASSQKRFRQIVKLPRLYLLGCGSLFVFYTAALYVAVGLAKDREQLLEIALMNYLWPALTILFSLPLLKKRASLWLIPGTALALTGVFLVTTQGARFSWMSWRGAVQNNPAAYALALAAAITWALYSNLTRRWSGPQSDGAVELFVPATGIVLLALRLMATEPTAWSLRVMAEASGLAVVTSLAYILWDLAMRKGNLLLVVACSYFTPLLSTGVSCLYLKVSPDPKLWIGCALLISGSLVTWRSVSDPRVPETG